MRNKVKSALGGKKLSLILVLILSLGFVAFAENSEKPAEVKKQGLQIKPRIFWSILSPVVINLETKKTGFTIVAADAAFVRYKKFYFGGIGAGISFYMYEDYGSFYDPYWRMWRYGYHYDQEFKGYLKLTPAKYYLGQKLFRMKTFAEVALTFEGKKLTPCIALGLTVSGNPLKKRPKEEEEED